MNVVISNKALNKLKEDNVTEFTISIKSSGGWQATGAPFLVMGGCDDLDGTFIQTEADGIKVNVKTCIKSPSKELTVNYGGLFKKVFYVSGALEF